MRRKKKRHILRFNRLRVHVKVTDRIVYALCLSAPWSLLWLDSSLLFPYTTGKAWLFRSIVELAFALSLIVGLDQWRVGSPYSKPGRVYHAFVAALLGFLVWSFICNVFGIDAYRSFWSNWERMSGFLAYLHWAMYLWCLLAVLNRKRTRGLLLNLAIVSTLVCVISLFDLESRGVSTLGNPIYVGNLAVFGVFIAAYLLTGWRSGKGWMLVVLRVTLALAMIVMVAAVFKSASRGPLLALFAGVVVLLLGMSVGYARQGGWLRVSAFGFGLVILGGLMPWDFCRQHYVFKHSENYALQRLGKMSLTNQTTADRLENWRIALDAAQSRPWLGWGQENYMIAFNQYYRPGIIDRAKLWFDRAHNAYLDALLASGIPGLLLYCLLLGLPMWLIWQIPDANRFEKSIFMGLLASFMVKNLVGFDTFSSTLIWVSLMAVILNARKSTAPSKISQSTGNSSASGFITLIFLLVSMFAIYELNVRPYQDNRRFAKLMNQSMVLNSEVLDEVLRQSESSLRYAQNAKLAVFDKMLTISSSTNTGALEQQAVERLFLRAGRLVSEALRQQPENYRIKYNGAMLLARLGEYDLSSRLLEELTLASPNRTAFWYALAQVYAAQGREESALEARKMATKLNPEWNP